MYRRCERFRRITDELGLEVAYGATIRRIKAHNGEKSRLGMANLMWVAYMEWPLRADELCHALAVELASPDFNTSNIPSLSTLLLSRAYHCGQGGINCATDPFYSANVSFHPSRYFR